MVFRRNPFYGMPGKFAPFQLQTYISMYYLSNIVCTCTDQTSGCWTNALQPLWLAGKAMSHCSEHEAIVDTLTRIERETGWATAWRVEDLKEFWGDDD